MQHSLRLASGNDLAELLPMVTRYHASERIDSSPEERARALNTLLCDPRFGMVWLIRIGQTAVGYIAVCFCYSIEFGGTDSFIDEFFIDEEYRERGLGTMAIEHIVQELRQEGIRAVSLEVANLNNGAKRLYSRCGFTPRDRYSLMTKRL